MCLHETLDINVSLRRIYGLYVWIWCNIAILHIVFLRPEISGSGKICHKHHNIYRLVLLSNQKIIFEMQRNLYFSRNDRI